MGKQIDLMSEDSVNPATAVDQGAAHDRAGRRRCCCSAKSPPASSLTIMQVAERNKKVFFSDRRPLGRAARQGLQPLLLPLRHPEHRDGQRRRHRAQRDKAW